MTDIAALLTLVILAVIAVQAWLFLNALRLMALEWLAQVFQIRTWNAVAKAAQAARKAQEHAHWEAQGRQWTFDYDLARVTSVTPDKPAVAVPTARQWQVALIKACWWGERVGFTEAAWDENKVVCLPETGELYEQGRRDIVKELDALGITANGGKGRTWAKGMSYGRAVALLDETPPLSKWSTAPPPAVKLPFEPAKLRSHEPKTQSTAPA